MPLPIDFDLSYCGPAPTLANLASRWNFDPFLILALALAALLGFSLLRNAPAARRLSFGLALLGAAVLFISPLCALTVALLSARVSHHVALTMVIAPLLALALPAPWAAKLPSLPLVIVSTIALWLWHAPDIYSAAFASPVLYWAMQLSLLTAFTALWLVLLRTPSAFSAGGAALASAIQMGFLGALLVFAPTPLYAPHFASSFAFGLSPLEDQQLAGLIMWVPANLPLLAVAVWRLVGLLRPSGRAIDDV